MAIAAFGDPLSPREAEILALIAAGDTNPEIADALYISESTVKTHIDHVCTSLGARNRTHAVHLAHLRGDLTAPALAADTALVVQAREMGYRLAVVPCEVAS